MTGIHIFFGKNRIQVAVLMGFSPEEAGAEASVSMHSLVVLSITAESIGLTDP